MCCNNSTVRLGKKVSQADFVCSFLFISYYVLFAWLILEEKVHT